MLRKNSKRATAMLMAACAVLAGLSYLHSGDPAAPQADEKKPAEAKPHADLYDDGLPAGAVKRLGTVRFRHNSTAIAYSPDGKILASGGRDNVVRLFDAASGKEIRRLVGHAARSYNPPTDASNPFDLLVTATGEGGVNSVAFSPDGKTLASGGWDDTVRLWDVQTGKQLRKIDAHKAMVAHVAFSPDGKVLASRGGLDGAVRLWDPLTGTRLQQFTGLSNINPWRFNFDLALAISPDGKTVAATTRDTLVLYDVASGAELKRLPSHVYGITAAYSPDGKLLATGGVDPGDDQHSLRIWDVAVGKEIRRCTLPKNEAPTYISWDPNNNGKLAAVIAEDFMHIFDANTGKEVVPVKHYWPSRVVYSPDGKTLASAGSGPTIRRWDAATGNEIAEQEGHESGVAAVAIATDGKLIASAGEDVRLWDATSGKLVRKIDIPGGATCLAFGPDGKTLAAGGLGRVVHLWETDTGKQISEFKGHNNSVRGLAFSQDGKLLATGDAQSTVRIWDVQAPDKPVQEMDEQSITEAIALAFAPDGKTLFCGGAWNDNGFKMPKGTVLKINGKEVKVDGDFVLNIQGVKMTPKDGNYVLAWDPSTGKEVRRLGGLSDMIRSLALSPDGKTAAAASRDGVIGLWDAETGKERLYINAHLDQTDQAFSASPCLAWAPDGKTLASAGTDHTIRLWDATTAKEKGRFVAPDSAFTSLIFSPNGKTLISGSADTGVLVWDVNAAPPPQPKSKGGAIGIQ
jgi:WD40 repeat protein